ncbi:adenylate kinase [Solibaculum mannosilyticum]|uniref:Adenylate kinase n=1 Tax=Solibaculum mannosilyticum TaxID=2780922 RepID=A0A7I8CZ34_9FIRM|nr:adenylate kinase [Solibaculum mannosilyticum]BCI59750.1 adenylate kinase [Solibaculum mannosilyticum]
MVFLIAGASHTGKTVLAQKILEKYRIPYLSIDHLKMGLIRSGNVSLTPEDDEKLESYLWPIVREMIKTAVENRQNLVIEGAYIPFDWKESFDSGYLKDIRYYCLVMTKRYIENHFSDIQKYENAIETRKGNWNGTVQSVVAENTQNLELCRKYGCDFILIDTDYQVDIEL